ncbi:hypothetical protein ABID82_001542 [Methylobacterium sp. PvP062]|uniref:Uncharacterized protein n=1 Tax=Methylobacterium radiotolerans TaxID=31998 RepID=A0ABV2NC02_9HYPH|nr:MULTISPECIES: hypothetical protein [unclassified Methylobacterium]MBP2492745.1 hypothetical protein [Methylobacterium sp. PvP105]MBP2500883.1 hypothetical protein [Methylobacterium sp. PvP109]MCX7336414.1 hypothetical protein [Hyphomicrobiales bacterium]
MFRKPAFDENQATIDALTRSLAIIEFGMDGTIRNYPRPCAGRISLILS